MRENREMKGCTMGEFANHATEKCVADALISVY